MYSLNELIETSATFSNETINESATQDFIINNISDETLNNETIQAESNTREEQIRLAKESIKKLKELTLKMKTPERLAHLEKESA